jgi:hypothetical protein
MVEAELKHGRVCMLAVVGMIVPSIVTLPVRDGARRGARRECRCPAANSAHRAARARIARCRACATTSHSPHPTAPPPCHDCSRLACTSTSLTATPRRRRLTLSCSLQPHHARPLALRAARAQGRAYSVVEAHDAGVSSGSMSQLLLWIGACARRERACVRVRVCARVMGSALSQVPLWAGL